MTINAIDRKRLADRLCLSEPYLYQCLSGRKLMNPKEAVRIEQESGGELMRWHLRVSDWHLVWPELINAKGAPTITAVVATKPSTEEVA